MQVPKISEDLDDQKIKFITGRHKTILGVSPDYSKFRAARSPVAETARPDGLVKHELVPGLTNKTNYQRIIVNQNNGELVTGHYSSYCKTIPPLLEAAPRHVSYELVLGLTNYQQAVDLQVERYLYRYIMEAKAKGNSEWICGGQLNLIQ